MRRREFITLLVGAAAWPISGACAAARANARVGVLFPASASDPLFQSRLEAFQQALHESGWTIGPCSSISAGPP